ncbi:MAG: gas vesicle protein [Oceanicoccus sp.]|jgi:gas vesicle protein
MLGRNKDDKKKQSSLDKIMMGAIIGTAVGSAIGASMAPKKGKETRKELAEKSQELAKEAKEVAQLTRETATGFFNLAKRLVLGKKKKVRPAPKAKKKKNRFTPHEDMKAIPHEGDLITEDTVE